MQEIVNGLPNISGNINKIQKINLRKSESLPEFYSRPDFSKIKSAFGIALHMHQPTILSSENNLGQAGLINNLEYMMHHQDTGDNHNASVFFQCYRRMADFIPELVSRGKNPRVMFDYSGNLLWGLRQMEQGKALEDLKLITLDEQYHNCIEWLGTMWSHAVVSSTPIPDIRLQILAWQNHFTSIFGEKALERVRGFSPPEMHLPIHPDACYEYVKALKECGYQWLLVQEYTVENLDGSGIQRPNFPHRLVAKNSSGEVVEIIALIKTQGSDTKLVAQMQPYYEAQSKSREYYQEKELPPFVLQISDGENGGVMMNEFPPKYNSVMDEISLEGTVALNGSEYLDLVFKTGFKQEDFIAIQPVSQHKIWEFVEKPSPGAADRAIEKTKIKYQGFNLEKASWTNDKDWVKGYEDVMDPINKLSAAFHKKYDNIKFSIKEENYQKALLYLLLSQTSCFRYWGSGLWTEYAKEICRRGFEAIEEN